jgi:glycosyltransferase involved in cell wall biosynthesis
MAMALPVVATNIGGSLDQVADGVSGFLVPPADPEALARKIELLAAEPELRRQMGAAGLTRMATLFTLEQMVKKVETLYSNLLGRGDAGRGPRFY